MKKIVLILVFSLLVLAGCNQETVTPPPEPVKLTLRFETEPNQPMPGHPIQLKAKVQKGKQPVENAKVELEFWKDGAKKHEMLKTEQGEKGIYTATKTFSKTGKYQVVVHVTTPETHQMINPSFTVGEADHHANQNEGHAHSELSMHMMLPDQASNGTEQKLTAHVLNGGKPLQQAEVQFEIWKKGEQKHEYVPASERKAGEYVAIYRFPTSGSYHIKLHVEKGDSLHDHTEEILEVK